MAKRIGFGDYQYEYVEGWPKVEIKGGVADLAIDAQGRIYAGVRSLKADGSLVDILGGGGTVLVLDRDGNALAEWGDMASSPHGVWVNQAGEVFLADTGFHTITKHAPTGEVLLTLGTKGQANTAGAPFNMPTHAVQAPNGDIVVSDGYGQNRIHRFSAKGEHILSFGGGDSVFIPKRFGIGPTTGTPGTAPCEFNVPHELLVTEDSRIFVMDRENSRWQVFTLDGEFISMQNDVNHPNRIALDRDGTFHIAGGAGIEIWKRDGTRIGSWGEKGSGPGQFVTGSVHGTWMDTDGSIYTAEAGHANRLQKFVRV